MGQWRYDGPSTHVILLEFIKAVGTRVLERSAPGVTSLALDAQVDVGVGASAQLLTSVDLHVILEHCKPGMT